MKIKNYWVDANFACGLIQTVVHDELSKEEYVQNAAPIFAKRVIGCTLSEAKGKLYNSKWVEITS